ncbi:MAG TPA: helix-turn-helix domain-containing protein, partial [Nannocystis sp.]
LRVLEIALPPLRERREDIPDLVRHFVARFAGGRELEIPEDFLSDMSSRPWPGNVRELENACERATILCTGDVLSTADLPPAPPPAPLTEGDWLPALPEDGLSLVDLEKRVIERVLAMKRGNITQAAAYLRVPRHVLSYRMDKYGLRRGA